MAVAVVYRFPRDGIAIYDRHMREQATLLEHQAARRSHVCFEFEDGYTVVDVWDSLEDFEAFGDVLARVMAESHPAEGEARAGAIEITIHAVHHSIP